MYRLRTDGPGIILFKEYRVEKRFLASDVFFESNFINKKYKHVDNFEEVTIVRKNREGNILVIFH